MRQVLPWRTSRWLLLGIVVVLLGIQAVPVDRSNPPVESEVPAPLDVRPILRRACYDCHSTETVWPWYSRVAPVSWLVASDVHEGRGDMNFTAWDRLTPEQRAKRLREAAKRVADGDMPPWDYRLMHRKARLSGQDRSILRAWALSAAGEPQPPNGQ